MPGKTKQFKTEVQHLLDLMIHSLYSNKDIFLRELIANAADAIDKARFEAVTRPELALDWKIRIVADKNAKTLTISDNGIGMTEAEVIDNIGTIAKSGTKAFMKALEERQQSGGNVPELIGQFGVGFYSAFMVAEKVILTTRKAGTDEPAVCWESDGKASYSIEKAEKDSPGTEIVIKLKEDALNYLEQWKVADIVKKYSDYIAYPIEFPVEKTNDDKTTTVEDKVLNSQKAIWLKNPDEITESEHKSFFSHLTHQISAPMKTIQFTAEGTTEFRALIYIPEKSETNIFMPELQKKGLQLYVRRVYITDDCKELVPDYLRFLKGVVDSSDLPLNVSREILQENPLIAKIQKNVVRKVLGELKKMQETEPTRYQEFFREFGRTMKEGIQTDYTNLDKLKELVMYESLNTAPGILISLKEYVAAMPSNQKEIYFITGESRSAVESSPALEFFRSKGWDVLLMTDPIDEWIMQSVTDFDGKPFKSVAKGEIELDKSEKEVTEKKLKEAAEAHQSLLEFLKKELEENISEVRFSPRLTESACCLVSDQFAMGAHMERFYKAMNKEMKPSKRILELNPDHPLISGLQALYDRDNSDSRLKDYAVLLRDQALLAEGSPIQDPLNFAKKVSDLMVLGVGK
ncbi:MAG: molecular chaperone HtpG [Victivallaceae bacterium]|nr:molecular chaperone HtpG [Victivallaceae bacterium]